MSVYSTWLFLRPLKREGERGREEWGREGSECRRLRTNLLLSWRAAPEPERVITAAHKLLSVSCKLHDKVISTPCWERGEKRVERERGVNVASEWENESKSDKKKRMSKKQNAKSAANKYFISATLAHTHTRTQKPQHVCMLMCVCWCVCATTWHWLTCNVLRGAACCDTHMPQHTAGRGTQTAPTHAHICIAHTHVHSTHTHTHVDCTHTCIHAHILQYTCNLVQHEQFNSISIATRNKLCLPSPSLFLVLSSSPSLFLRLPL